MRRVAVIGGGPAGITAAYALTQKGCEVDVFEAAPQIGGMARSFPLWGVTVDLGPHRFFSKNARVNHLWHDLVGPDYQMVERLTRIFYQGRFYDYPLKPGNALGNLGWLEAARCAASYGWQLMARPWRGAPPASFEDWVVRAFGRRLYELFFQSYSEKLWGIPCHELDVDFAAQRIQHFSLARALWAALGLERTLHKTLLQRFPHPIQGAGVVYERMGQRIRAAGGRIHLSSPIAGVTADGLGLRLDDGAEYRFDDVVSTMPLTQLCQALPDLPESVRLALGRLTYRHTVMVYLKVEHPSLFPDQWLYMQSPDFRLGRITNFRNWPNGQAAASDASILALEYWCDPGDALWSAPDAALIQMGIEEMTRTGLLRGAPVSDGVVVRVPQCYPVYRKGYHDWLDPVVRHLQTACPRLLAIGRCGAFKYNNQDHSILMGLLAADNIADGAHHDLWAINTDYDIYQEDGTVPGA
jgi:protoporphyrinogen oxidase